MKITTLGKGLYHIMIPERKDLAKAMMRIQEYYESPFKEIRNQIFTLGQLKAIGSRENPGVNSYCGGIHFDADWSGYNWPGYCLDPFIKGLFDPLTDYEKDMVELFRYNQGRFYVIGTYGEEDPGDTLEHEIRHAMYYLLPRYKEAVDKELAKYDLSDFKKWLTKVGYAEEVFDDECQAYLGPDHDWFFNEKYKDLDEDMVIQQRPELSKVLNSIAKQHKVGFIKEKK